MYWKPTHERKRYMAKKQENTEYKELKSALSAGTPKNLYLFHGEERYLLEYYLGELRKTVLEGGAEEFNYKRLEGKDISVNQISEEIDSLPVFAERTMIEIYDYDVFGKEEHKAELTAVLSELPEYAYVVFVYDTLEFKVDSRLKSNAALKKLMTIVEFQQQDQSDLTAWISRRFRAVGKRIDRPTAEYLAFASGGLMTRLVTEVEKLAAFSKGDIITREAIDAVVEPVVEAAVFRMTDALLKRDYNTSVRILGDLLKIQEAPHKIIFSISQKMRQLLAARVLIDSGGGVKNLMELYGIRFEFQAQNIMSAARRTDRVWCRAAVAHCSAAAFKMNSGFDGGETLSQLLVELALTD